MMTVASQQNNTGPFGGPVRQRLAVANEQLACNVLKGDVKLKLTNSQLVYILNKMLGCVSLVLQN